MNSGNDDYLQRQDTPAKQIGLWLGLIIFVVLCLLPSPEGLSQAGMFTLALLALMVIWWVSEALPIGITSLLPIVIAPLFGIATLEQTLPAYAHKIIFLLMGGFIIGKSIVRWNLHERIALGILSKVGTKPSSLIAGFMVTSALLSMWISNTATTIMLVPIVLSVAAVSTMQEEDKKSFTLAALLGTAWAASIGGLGTPIGTAPNLIVIGFLEEMGDNRFSFLNWMKFGIPVVLIMVPTAFLVLTKWGPKFAPDPDINAAAMFQERLQNLGKMRTPERRVIVVFSTVAFFWVFRRAFIQDISILGVEPFVGLTDHIIAIAGAIILFIIPSGSKSEPGTRLLDWSTAVTIPWDILLLFGGGLSMAALIKITGLSEWLGGELSFITDFPPIAMTFILVGCVIFFTELTSNTATTAAIMPIVAAVALQTGADPATLAIPIAMAASCAFMLPMATGPNAVIFGSGEVTMAQMAKAGFKLNLIGIVLITSLTSMLAQAFL
ncbi:MAG: DASS family sodium-coupled anion symporter [Hyphomonadaceae bacterium]|nr:DASS family sodium-coupled anion symporter [Hyphomonadaceae bacterium]